MTLHTFAMSLTLCVILGTILSLASAKTHEVYDFIVVGGGTAGLTVASRLSQKLPYLSILVLEAGPDGSAEPRIFVPGYRGSTIRSTYDWNFTSIPQPDLLGQTITLPRGKVLGGSSALNFLTWDRGSEEEYDAWEDLGNPGWNWESMYQAMLNVENFNRTIVGPSEYGEEGVGFGGPIQTSMNGNVPEQVQGFTSTMKTLGLEENNESLNGTVLGVSWQPTNIRTSDYTRSYSPRFLEIASENLIVRTDTTVAKVNIDAITKIATGVTLLDGTVISARKEVILSAGSFSTPQLLELSGVGNDTILSAAGIQTIVSLPSVGENLQDHVVLQSAYELKPNFTSIDVVRFNSTRSEEELTLWVAGEKSLYQRTGSNYAFLNWEQAFGPDNIFPSLAQSILGSDLVSQKKLSYITDPALIKRVSQFELILADGYIGSGPYPPPGQPGHGKQFISIVAPLMHPLGIGNVHIDTSSPLSEPIIDPRFLSNEYDFEAARHIAKYMRRVANTAPLADVWQTEFEPGEHVQTDEQWEEYVRTVTNSINHPIGTASMLPYEEGGVVDSELKVYGVTGLRVVDASVMPVIVGAHIQTAVYGIAERAAGLVAQDWQY